MDTTTKLDRIIDGTRYRSTRRMACAPFGRAQYVHGVRDVALWICRDVIVLETYSQWDDGTGRCIGTMYTVLDPREDRDYDDRTVVGAEARDRIQAYADAWEGYGDGDLSDDTLSEMARRHAPVG
jgi:hypothetical protein